MDGLEPPSFNQAAALDIAVVESSGRPNDDEEASMTESAHHDQTVTSPQQIEVPQKKTIDSNPSSIVPANEATPDVASNVHQGDKIEIKQAVDMSQSNINNNRSQNELLDSQMNFEQDKLDASHDGPASLVRQYIPGTADKPMFDDPPEDNFALNHIEM